MRRKIEKQLPCKITLNVIIGYDIKQNPIKQKLLDVYALPIDIRNASNTTLICTEFKEIITGRIIARSFPDHKYLEFPDFLRYGTYTGKLDKTYQLLKIGDIDIEYDPGYGLSGLLECNLDPSKTLDCRLVGTLGAYYKKMMSDVAKYKDKYDEKALNDYLGKLDYIAMQRAFPLSKIDSSKPLNYYNKEEYVFIDDDDLLILKYREIPFDSDWEIIFGNRTFLHNYYYEIVTGRKFAIECGTDNHMDKKQTFHFDRDFNREVLASRILSEDALNAYKKEKPKVISKRIDDVLDRQYARDRKRIADRKKAI
ncbi:MAG: hypothetical protein K2G03_05655 [Bacilli bacterium]|nr:hypothetical protein [Bacilli bacterium]